MYTNGFETNSSMDESLVAPESNEQNLARKCASSSFSTRLVTIEQILVMLKNSGDIDIDAYKQICTISNELDQIQAQITSPQILDIVGLEHIKLDCRVTDYKDRVDTLFFQADIPLYWILSVDQDLKNTNVIHVTLLNYFVKEKVKTKLLRYLQNTYKNSVVLQ